MIWTTEGLLDDLESANERRSQILRERSEIIDKVIAGDMPMLEAMAQPAVRRMYAYTFLLKMPRIGRVTARKILREVNVGETQRISTTGRCQRERMATLVAEAHPRGRR